MDTLSEALNWDPPNSDGEVLTPEPQHVTLLGNEVVTDVIREDEATLGQGGPRSSMTAVLIKRGNLDRQVSSTVQVSRDRDLG